MRSAETKADRVVRGRANKKKQSGGRETRVATRRLAIRRNAETWKLENLTRQIGLKIVGTPRAKTERGNVKTLLRESRYARGTGGEEAARGEARERRVRDERRGFGGRRLGTTREGRERG